VKLRIAPSTAEPGAQVRLTVDAYSQIGNEVSITSKPKLWTADGDLDLLQSETPEGQRLLANRQLDTASNNVDLEVRDRDSVNRSGIVTFRIQVAGQTATASLQIVLNATGLLALYVQPPTIGLARGAQQQFGVVARNAQGVAVPVDNVTWEVTGGLVVDGTGRVTVPADATAGTAEVTAKVTDGEGNESSDTAEVVVSANEPENRVFEVLVYPRSVRLYTGSSQTFLAIAIDRTGVVVPEAEFSWSVNKGIASIDRRSGILTTGTTEGELQVTATLTNAEDNLSGSAEVTVEAEP
jgi:hypothetical protein